MRFSLNESPTYRYSAREKLIFSRIAEATSEEPAKGDEIVALVYLSDQPWNARTTAMGNVRSLIKKVEANEEPFRVASSKAAGPKQKSFWVEPKQP